MGRWRRSVTKDRMETKILQSGEKFVLMAGVTQDDATRLLATAGWKEVFQPGAARCTNDWKCSSIRLCTAIQTSESTVAGMNGALDWIRANMHSLIHTFEGHRLVEAALRRHFHIVGDDVAEALLEDTRVGPWSGRVWSCLLRYGRCTAVGRKCAMAMAARAQTTWENNQNAAGMYVLQTLVECDYDVSPQVISLFCREDALRKLAQKRPCYMTLLLACLRCPRPERRQLCATFLLLFDDVSLCYTVMKMLLRVKPVGVLILCEIAQHSMTELNVWFSDYFQAFLENHAGLEVLPPERLSPPTLESVQLLLAGDRALRTPRAIRYASALTRNGNSGLTLYCRLLKVQYDQAQDDAESTCATPSQLWSATPWEDEEGVWGDVCQPAMEPNGYF